MATNDHKAANDKAKDDKAKDDKAKDDKAKDDKARDRKAKDDTVTTYTLKQAIAAKVGNHVEIAVEAEDGTRLKIVATSEQLDVLTGDLESILDADDSEAETAA